jgi:predicted DCC family thiol-disulfide oxidoreductase YuxK
MTLDNEILASSHQHPIIVFDGVCMLCDKSVQWIIKHDKDLHFKFCTLQSTETNQMNSVILIQQGKVYTKSLAILKILKILGGWYHVAAWIGGVLPMFMRDRLYDFVAKNRYKWFGKYDECLIPDREWRKNC